MTHTQGAENISREEAAGQGIATPASKRSEPLQAQASAPQSDWFKVTAEECIEFLKDKSKAFFTLPDPEVVKGWAEVFFMLMDRCKNARNPSTPQQMVAAAKRPRLLHVLAARRAVSDVYPHLRRHEVNDMADQMLTYVASKPEAEAVQRIEAMYAEMDTINY